MSETELSVRVPALAERLPGIRHALAAWCRRVKLSEDDTDAVVAAVYEAMANVVDHAYPASRTGILTVLARCPAGQDATVLVIDQGRWRPPGDPAVTGRGRGLQMMRSFAQTVEILPTPQGTTVHLRWPHRR